MVAACSCCLGHTRCFWARQSRGEANCFLGGRGGKDPDFEPCIVDWGKGVRERYFAYGGSGGKNELVVFVRRLAGEGYTKAEDRVCTKICIL